MEKILVVDDDSGNRNAAVQLLMKAWPSCEILTAPNGKIGLEVALGELPDLILLDWEMPEMNGLEMLHAIRQSSSTRDIPVVMCTGIRTQSGNLKNALDAGANEFLRKPYDPVEMVARIKSVYSQAEYAKEQLALEQEQARIKSDIQRRELELKRNDLTAFALILEQKNLFLKSILNQVEELTADHPASIPGPAISKIVWQLKQELKTDKNWEFIKVRMNSIHSDFLAMLVQKHPDLTKTELKLCTLMKLNLSRKETANILHISVSGVEKQRYRLRKKLKLEPSQKMENYIHSLSGPGVV